MPLYQVAPTRQLPHTIDLIQRSGFPRFLNEIERDQQYPDPELGALCVVNTTVEVFNGTGWIRVGGGAPTLINNLQDVDARFPPDGAVLTWSSAAQAWGWSMPATAEPTCITFSDDFERADGPLGSNWATGPTIGTGGDGDFYPLTISSGAAIGTVAFDPGSGAVDSVNLMHWTAPMTADQSIEIDVEPGVWASPNTQYVQLYTHTAATGLSAACAADFYFTSTGVEVASFLYDSAGNSTDASTSVGVAHAATSVRLRLESDADGTQRIYVDDMLAVTHVLSSAPSGPHVAVSLGYYLGESSPRILSVTGGCLEV